MSAATKSQLIELIESQKETIAIQAKKIVSQGYEITNAVEQITQICEGLGAIAKSNTQTRAMVEEITEKVNSVIPEPAWWD